MAVIAPIVSTFDNRGIRNAEGAFGNFSRAVGRQLKNVAIAATAIGVAVGAAVAKAVGAASDLDEAVSATRQIFGDASDAVLAFADSAAEAFGQSKQEALDGALVFGTFGKAAGLAGDDLSNFTNGLLGLSSDIASFRNATPQEAIEAIGAALRGESEPLRRFGVLLDDATLKAEALELGIYSGSGALTQQQKILAAESAIYKQTADAQGDFARTSDGLANSQRILRARLANTSAQIGTAFLPIAVKMAGFLLDKVVPAVEGLADAFERGGLGGALDYIGPKIADFVNRAGSKLLELGKALVDWIGPRIGPAIAKLLEWLTALGEWIIGTALPWLLDKTVELGTALIDWIGPRIGPAIAKLLEWLTALGGWIIGTALPWLVEKASQLGGALIDWIGPRIVPAIEALGEWVVTILDWIIFDALPKLVTQAAKLGAALIGWIIDIAPDVLKGLGTFALVIFDWIKNDAVPRLLQNAKSLGGAIKDGILNGLAAAGEGALNLGRTVVNGIIRLINTQLIDRLNRAFEFTIPLPFVDDIRVNPPDIPGIPQLAKGGIVTKPTLAIVGEAGPEAVIPLSKMGGTAAGGTVVNVTINGAIDPVSTARQIRQILEQDQRRLGRLAAV
jgi:hypothetical protein